MSTTIDFLVPPDTVAASPSSRDGISVRMEVKYRRFACDLVQRAGLMLRLPQSVMTTAQSIIHRFYYRQSLAAFDAHQVAMAAIFLAAKVEEHARRALDVVNVFVALKQVLNGTPKEPLDPSSSTFDTWKATLFLTEAVILKELGYDMYAMTCHPHRFLLLFVEVLGGSPQLSQLAWNHVNDVYRLAVCVQHPPETIACAGILVAARELRVGLPQSWHTLLCPATPKATLYTLADTIQAMYADDCDDSGSVTAGDDVNMDASTRTVKATGTDTTLLCWLPSLRREE